MDMKEMLLKLNETLSEKSILKEGITDPKELLGKARKMAKSVERSLDEMEHLSFASKVRPILDTLHSFYRQNNNPDATETVRKLFRRAELGSDTVDYKLANDIVNDLYGLMITNEGYGKKTKKMTEANDEDGSDTDENLQIKPVMGFQRLVELLFTDADAKVGRIALRKVLNGMEDKLTLRERTAMASGVMRILPILAQDRMVFNRIEKKLSEMQ